MSKQIGTVTYVAKSNLLYDISENSAVLDYTVFIEYSSIDWDMCKDLILYLDSSNEYSDEYNEFLPSDDIIRNTLRLTPNNVFYISPESTYTDITSRLRESDVVFSSTGDEVFVKLPNKKTINKVEEQLWVQYLESKDGQFNIIADPELRKREHKLWTFVWNRRS